MKLHLYFSGPVDLDRPEHIDHLCTTLGDCLHEYRDCAEVVTWFDGVEYYATYLVKPGDDGEQYVECFVQPRADAERFLNNYGYTTREPFLPPFET